MSRRNERIAQKAELIDQFVQYLQNGRNRTTFPHQEVASLIHALFPKSAYIGRGAYKSVYRVHSQSRGRALKTSNPKNILNDVDAYHRLPKTIRNQHFAKIYWWTRCCLLQKYGRKAHNIPRSELKRLKQLGECPRNDMEHT